MPTIALCLKHSLIRKGLRPFGIGRSVNNMGLKHSLIRKGLRQQDLLDQVQAYLSETLPDS